MQMALVRIMMRLATIAILIHLAKAKSYIVGAPNGGWGLNTPLQAWANLNSFFVGDSLTFVYAPSHDVVEVTKTDYDTCLASNPIQLYSGGNSVISLSSPGDRYFICGVPSHCDLGMKVTISTLSPPPPPTTPPLTPPSSAASLPTTTTGSISPPATSSGGSPISPTGSAGSGSSSGGSAISPTGSGSGSGSGLGSASSPATTNSGVSPSISPSNSHVGSPLKISPSASPSNSPAASIASPPAGLSGESPILAPLPSVSSPSSQPSSSADKISGIASFITMGFGITFMLRFLPL